MTARKAPAPKWEDQTKGFEEVGGNLPPALDLQKVGETLIARVEELRNVRIGKKKRKERVMIVMVENTGELHTVWPSAGLKPLIKIAKRGYLVAIKFTGWKDLAKGRMRTYALAINRNPTLD